jgi:predicted O-linked N-acetylglucosamine transferase (SPINDLY family)
LQPDNADSHNLLGLALMEQGRLEEAEAAVREALRLHPDNPAAYNTLGLVLFQQSQPEQAAANFGRAVQLQPSFVEAWLNLGDALRGLGRRDEAGASYERAAQLRPNDPGPVAKLGALLMELGRPADAVLCYERALRLRPDSAILCNNLGLALLHQGRYEEARLSCRQTLYLQPDLAEAHNNQGLALLNLGRAGEALLSFRQAVDLQPDFADAHNNLGLALAASGQPDEALACYQRAVQITPHHVGALTNLGNARKDQGFVSEAIACYRQALAAQPENAAVHSNLLLALHYQVGADPLEMLAEARRYAQRHAAPWAGALKPPPLPPRQGRRLRIGYVSADFREHPVAYFLEPILANHDHQRYEVFCYADVARPDARTQRFQGYADQWRSLLGLSDEQAAERIRKDGIDVLVDLNGHTGGNRLLVFARKPAPIQVSYLGYLGTTGLSAMDYYLTDAHADPPGLAEAYYQEQLVRLPECGFCYLPGDAPEVRAELPARQLGRVTFASLNTVAKLTEEVLALWARILAAVTGSRLLLRSGASRQAEERIRATLTGHGVAPDRLVLIGPMPSRMDYLKLYQSVDLCLDPFPYNGVTTTCDALRMGVPVLTWAGRMNVSRQGVRFLRNVGLDELIAETPERYVRLATELADDLDRLAAPRAALRERMRRSPLTDAPQFTRHLEGAYQEMGSPRSS